MKTDPAMKVATSGDGTLAMWAAAKYDAAADLRRAWGRLFRVVAWVSAVPSFGLLLWSAIAYHAIREPKEGQTLAYFVNDYVAACGVGITALFASIALPRTRKRDVAILFGACAAGVMALYLPSLLHAWPVLASKKLPATAVVPLVFPFGLLGLAAAAAVAGRRARPAAKGQG